MCRPGSRRCGSGSLKVDRRFGRISGAVFSFLPLEEWRREWWRHNSWRIPRGAWRWRWTSCVWQGVAWIWRNLRGHLAIPLSGADSTLVVGGTICFVCFIREDPIVAMIILDPDIEGLGKLFKARFGLDNSFGVIMLVQMDVVNGVD